MAPFQRKSSAASQQNLRPGFPPTAMFRRPSRSPFATCRGADAGRSSMSGFGSAHRAHRLLLRQRAEARWRCGSRSVTCGVVGDQVTLVAKLASRSRRAEGFRGEEVLDRRELPDALGCPGRALILELILVRLTILGVSFDLLAFESREMAADSSAENICRTSETNRGSSLAKAGCSEAALAKFISFSPTA